jgi:S-formylglutathione hydrolase FrmB
MRTGVRTVAVVAVGAVLLGTHSAGARTVQPDVDTSFASRALAGRVRVAVVLPPGYRTSGLRYPVVYFLHGLPASGNGYRSVGLAAEALRRLERRTILVEPQGARDSDTDAEYLDRGLGRRWETAIARELPRFVDARFRTIATRRGRALVGVSAGGYGAVTLALHHLDAFSVVESWGGYFHPTDPSGHHALDLGSRAANRRASAHTLVPRLRTAFRARPTFLAFYVGKADARFRAENVRLHAELRSARVPHLFRLYPGGHEEQVWSAHARFWLSLAVAHLASARPAAP